MHDKLIGRIALLSINVDNKQFKSSRVKSTSFDFSVTQF